MTSTIEPELAPTLDPQAADRVLRAHADAVQADLCEQDESWQRTGWTRRTFLSGLGMAGVAALGTQLVTTRASYAATPATVKKKVAPPSERTVIVVFLRGACDGLRALVPASADLGMTYLRGVRPNLLPSNPIALPNAHGWAVNAGLKPLYDSLWKTGELAFVPGISSPGVSRSHFQAQAYLEKGGSDTATSGWLERTLEKMGPGTTFRAVADGYSEPVSLAGTQPVIAMSSLANFKFPAWDSILASSKAAVAGLYRGMGGTLGADVPLTMAALSTAETIRAKYSKVQNGAVYPSGAFSQSLKDLASILRAEVGMQIATVDVGGWDTHTNEATQLDPMLSSAAQSLAAFMKDLGPTRRKRVTVVVMTEFGRRVAMNASGGSDHGHGSVMWLLGGGLARSGVFGKWTPLSDLTLDQGDVPGVNNPFDVLGEIVQKRLNVGSTTAIFPGHRVQTLGVAKTT